MRRLEAFGRSEAGGVAAVFAAMGFVLFGMTALGIELARANRVKSIIQNAGDAAAIAGARELSMAGADSQIIANIANGSVKRFIEANSESLPSVSSDTQITTTPLEVRVKVSAELDLPFGAVFGRNKIALTSESVARVVGQPNLCVLGLDGAAPATVWLGGTSIVTGKNCSVFSNSIHAGGLASSGGGVMTASTICSAGGISGSLANFRPKALTDCPTFKDPLSDRAPPPAGGCNHLMKFVIGGTATLKPGVYCGGLNIQAGARVTLEPGEYIIRDGTLRVGSRAELHGNGVGFYFDGPLSTLNFGSDATIVLRAPTTGPMAGLLFFTDRAQPEGRVNIINSDNARVLVGTIYMPNAKFVIDASKTVGDLSEYTAIVARNVEFRRGTVVLNADYGLTDVPVPSGIKGAGQPVALYH